MASKPILIYFDMAGRAEAIRMTFHVGGVEFEDRRITKDEFIKMKPNLPFGQVPVLEINGDMTSQSVAILMYAAKRANVLPEEGEQRMRGMEIIMGIEDLVNKVSPSIKTTDKEEKLQMRKALASETVPFYLSKLEAIVAKNNSHGFCVGDKLTVADISVTHILSWFKSGWLDGISTKIGEPYKRLNEVVKTVENHPKIKEWRAKQLVSNGK